MLAAPGALLVCVRRLIAVEVVGGAAEGTRGVTLSLTQSRLADRTRVSALYLTCMLALLYKVYDCNLQSLPPVRGLCGGTYSEARLPARGT